jgi:hypothetical protein
MHRHTRSRVDKFSAANLSRSAPSTAGSGFGSPTILEIEESVGSIRPSALGDAIISMQQAIATMLVITLRRNPPVLIDIRTAKSVSEKQ